jgi:Ca2+-binding EF-hand superfamily protein
MPDFNDLDLFAVFRDFDKDGKGFLEPTEFYTCLESFKPLKLLPSEVTSLVLLCDCDLNMRIDYAEIMKVFREMVYLIKFHSYSQKFH